MTIKDFKPGQTVYALSRTRGKTTEHFIKRYTVVSVGRKYVRAAPEGSINTDEFFLDEETDSFLTENITWRERTRLFLTEAAANDGIELDMLRDWFRRKAVESWRIEKYTLGQLRAVKEILEGQENGKNEDVQGEVLAE